MPYFSIIIPVYNVAPYLRECLDSVLAQTFTDWEAICVDDGSTDESGAILDEYAAKDKRFRVIHQANSGVSVARNMALDVVIGKWVFFLDGDDVISDGCFHSCREAISQWPLVDFVMFGYTTFDDGDKCLLDGASVSMRMVDISSYVDAQCAESAFCTIMYRRDLLSKLRFDIGVANGEDLMFYWRYIQKCRRSYCRIIGNFYGYRQRLASATHMPLTKKFVSDHVYSWILVIELVGSDDREYASLSVRQFALNSTELFARFLFSLSAPDRRECFYEWLDLIKHIKKSSFSKIPRWNALVFRVCAFTRSIVVLWLLCYLPNKLKLMGIHR